MATIPPTAPYRAYWRKLEQKKPTAKQRVLITRARREARRLAKILLEEFGAKRVYLFGSYAWGLIKVQERSDLDLAVEGIPVNMWWQAWDRLMKASRYSVDLAALEQAPLTLRELVLEFGTILYDAEKLSTAQQGIARGNRKTPARAN